MMVQRFGVYLTLSQKIIMNQGALVQCSMYVDAAHMPE